MNNKITRRPYTPPCAELICFAPQEEIAEGTWQPWFNPGDSWWLNHINPLTNVPSITGAFQWFDGYDENGNWTNSELD